MNKWLIRFLVLSIVIIAITKFILVDTPEFFKYGEEMGEVSFSIAISYIAAFIFYVVQVWYPNKELKQRLNSRISVPLSIILNDMKTTLEPFLKGVDFKVRSDVEKVNFDEDLSKINLLSYEAELQIIIGINETRTANHIEFIEYERNRIYKRIGEITKLPETDLELRMLLDEIENTSLYKMLDIYKTVIDFQNGEVLLASDIQLELKNFYHLFFRLREYMKSNNISITIHDLI